MKEYIEHTCGECIHSEICDQWPTRTGWDTLNPVQCRMFRSAADVVERKRGEWVDVVFDPVWKKMKATCTSCSHRGEIRVKSNYCGFVVPDSDFCPNCGADMRGENNG